MRMRLTMMRCQIDLLHALRLLASLSSGRPECDCKDGNSTSSMRTGAGRWSLVGGGVAHCVSFNG